MDTKNVFSRGIASGEAFCNRKEELKRILLNIKNITHTLLVSPRRYGKTSLSLSAIEMAKLPYGYIDLFMKCDSGTILNEFYQGLGELVSKIIKPTTRAIRKAESLLKNVSISRIGH